LHISSRWRRPAAILIAALALAVTPAIVGAQLPSTVNVDNNAEFGDILVAEDGLTLYIFTPDEPGVSNCNGGCAVAWPPLTVADGATPTLGMGTSGELTLITRDDGTEQVALNGAALYFFQGDSAPGDTNGQSLNDVWWVLTPDGTPIQPVPEQISEPEPTVAIGGNDTLGEFLVASNGLTLYIFTPDEPGVSNCNGGCAAAWPPLTVEDGATPTAGPGIAGELTLITRDDGSKQVALDGAALYFYRDDSVAGDSNGQDANDVWFVIDANGSIVQTPATPEAAGPPPTAAPAGNAGIVGSSGTSNAAIALLTLATLGLVLGGRRLVRDR